MTALPDALAPMGLYRQFLLYKLTNGTKLPCNVEGAVVNAHDSSQWVDVDTAILVAGLLGPEYGVAFVFTDNDPFWFVDIDKCLVDSQWSEVAMDLLGMLQGCAVEVSSSGRGLHIFGSGPVPDHGCKNIGFGLELYHTSRFVALTGDRAMGSAAAEGPISLVVDKYFPPTVADGDVLGWTTEPVEEWAGPEDDVELLSRALKAKSNPFSKGARFRDLWEAEPDVLAAFYPDGERAYDASSADAALAQHLAFWTGKDCERMQRLMWQSGLVREKWEREDYLPRTITRAVDLQRNVYSDPKSKPLAVAPEVRVGEVTLAAGPQIMPPSIQIEHFAGCVYVMDVHRVLTPRGSLLKPDQFNAMYGGFEFIITDEGKGTKKAWEAFTESQVVRYPKAEGLCFRPALAPGALVEVGGRVLANTYIPYDSPRKVGDVEPFLRHLRRLLPDEQDQLILLSYLAACVQHKGVKFQWAPLIQGCEGNGKTLFTRCLEFAVGERYFSSPKASEIGGKFNGWIRDKLIIGVEDIYVAEHKAEVLESLKPMITGERLEIENKGVDAAMGDVCANFIFNSNHKDAIRKHKGDRRYAVFYSAQQEPEDLIRDGMGGDYFPKLYEWLKADGFAIVNEFLHTYPIDPRYNPAGACNRAPTTSSTDEAIKASMGAIEYEIIEAIDQERVGFVGGWISSVHLDELLNEHKRSLSKKRQPDVLKSLGYIKHPALRDGRSGRRVAVDFNKKPRLYVHFQSDYVNSVDPITDYEQEQSSFTTN